MVYNQNCGQKPESLLVNLWTFRLAMKLTWLVSWPHRIFKILCHLYIPKQIAPKCHKDSRTFYKIELSYPIAEKMAKNRKFPTQNRRSAIVCYAVLTADFHPHTLARKCDESSGARIRQMTSPFVDELSDREKKCTTSASWGWAAGMPGSNYLDKMKTPERWCPLPRRALFASILAWKTFEHSLHINFSYNVSLHVTWRHNDATWRCDVTWRCDIMRDVTWHFFYDRMYKY